MVQRKVPNKIGIKYHIHKSDTQLVNLRPSSSSSSSQTHEKMKMIMKKSRSIKRSDESPIRKKKPQQLQPSSTPVTSQKQSPNYMKSTSSFEARKEQSPDKTPTPKGTSRNSKKNDQSASGVKGSRTSSSKMMRTLTKTPSFKTSRCSKKVILCEHVDAQRATCSSTLKESKFSNYLQLVPGGTELDGTSAVKVCRYSYCSLNGHHHAPVLPLKCFLSARRRAIKSQKVSKIGCLSLRQIKPNAKKFDVAEEQVISAPEEENKELFVGDQDLECSDSGLKLQETDGGVDEDEIGKMSVERLYDEESVSSGAWSEGDGDSASDSLFEQLKINQDYGNYCPFEVSSTKAESDMNDKLQGLIGDENINYQKEDTFQESKTVPDFAEKVMDETDKNHTRIIYNIIQFNILVFVNGENTEDKTVTVTAPATSVAGDKMETEEAMEEWVSMSDDEVNQMVAEEELPSNEQLTSIDNPEQECNDPIPSQSKSMDQTRGTVEITSETDMNTNSFHTGSVSNEPSLNLRVCNKPSEETGNDSLEFNPRGPNILPETPHPDAETVDLKHQMIDERKNAEEWMVDFALQQAVTTLAPARKRKVALLVEAFEKVMPDQVRVHEIHNRHTSKAFTNSRPMQACS